MRKNDLERNYNMVKKYGLIATAMALTEFFSTPKEADRKIKHAKKVFDLIEQYEKQ